MDGTLINQPMDYNGPAPKDVNIARWELSYLTGGGFAASSFQNCHHTFVAISLSSGFIASSVVSVCKFYLFHISSHLLV